VAAGELEEQPGVDRAEDRPLHALGVAQQPLDLGRREIRIDDQAGALAHELFVAAGAQLDATLGGAPVLPDQRPVQRLAALGIPGDHGLALVGDADRVELASLDAGVDDRLDRDPTTHLPYFSGVVLDPAGSREMLLELRVGPTGDPPLGVEDEAGRPRRPLVDRQDQGVTPRMIVSRLSATPEASSPVANRRSPIPYISATIVRAWRPGSGTSSISNAAAATPS
jgi:hypothetical protein